jgi:hypothetical protein
MRSFVSALGRPQTTLLQTRLKHSDKPAPKANSLLFSLSSLLNSHHGFIDPNLFCFPKAHLTPAWQELFLDNQLKMPKNELVVIKPETCDKPFHRVLKMLNVLKRLGLIDEVQKSQEKLIDWRFMCDSPCQPSVEGSVKLFAQVIKESKSTSHIAGRIIDEDLKEIAGELGIKEKLLAALGEPARSKGRS